MGVYSRADQDPDYAAKNVAHSAQELEAINHSPQEVCPFLMTDRHLLESMCAVLENFDDKEDVRKPESI